MNIRSLNPGDWSEVSSIYQKGINTGNATFEKLVPDWESWDKDHMRECRLVAEQNNIIVGWAALSKVSGRCIYSGVAEVSVYVKPEYQGKGIGRSLLEELIAQSEENGIWTLQAGIFPENKSSIRIHEHCGFKKIGVREKLGKMDGKWRDVLFMERRSQSVGQD